MRAANDSQNASLVLLLTCVYWLPEEGQPDHVLPKSVESQLTDAMNKADVGQIDTI
jgi:hypothetical protein